MAEEQATQKGKNLTFNVDNEIYGFEIKYVRQIISLQEVTPMPDQPRYIKGVVNLRGQIIPVMDIRLKLLKKEREYDDRTCIVVLDIDELSMGVIVDRVSEVIEIADENITDAPEFGHDIREHYIGGIGKVNDKIVILLDCRKLTKHDENYLKIEQ